MTTSSRTTIRTDAVIGGVDTLQEGPPTTNLTALRGGELRRAGLGRFTRAPSTAGDIHWKPPIAPCRAALEEVDRAAFWAEHQVVVVDQLGGSEAVVQLD